MSAVDVAEVLWLLLAVLGLNIAVGFGGLPVLGQGAFVAIGGYGTVLLADRAALPLGVAVALSVLGAAALGWAVGFGSARLHGAHLALATWGLAWLTFAALVAFPQQFGGSQGLVRPAPARVVSRFLGVEVVLTPAWHVGLAAALCAAVVVATRALARGPVGLDLAALREGPALAESLGIPSAARRRGALAAAAGLGALSGGATAVLLGLIAPADVSPLLSVQLLAAVLVGGSASVLGPVVGVGMLVALPHVAGVLATAVGAGAERSRGVVTAALLLAVVALRDPVVRRLGGRRAPGSAPREGGRPRLDPDPAREVPLRGAPLLVARDLRHAYGALRVLDGVDLEVRAGEVHALVGPNGSGKTTILRVLAGAARVQEGSVVVDGHDVTRLDQRGRVAAGVVRTFQATSLFADRTVAENVRAGARMTERGGVAWRALLRTPSWQAAARQADQTTAALVDAAGLTPHAADVASSLDLGSQRILQVTRAAATGAAVLLLDEPAAGLSYDEIRRLSALVRRLAGNGRGVLLVEHNMRFVSSVADRVTVIAEGRVLATGDPADVARLPAVRAAYLGTPAESR